MNAFKSSIAPTPYIAGISAVLDYHTWLSTNCVLFRNSSVDGGRVKLFPLLASTESANECGSIRTTSIVTDMAESSLGSSPTSVRDKIVLPTSSKESRIPSVRLFDLKRQNFLSRYSFKREIRFSLVENKHYWASKQHVQFPDWKSMLDAHLMDHKCDFKNGHILLAYRVTVYIAKFTGKFCWQTLTPPVCPGCLEAGTNNWITTA